MALAMCSLDLGYPDAVERQAKLLLVYALNQILDERKFTQAEAGMIRWRTTSWPLQADSRGTLRRISAPAR